MEQLFRQALALQRADRLEEAEALYRQVTDWRQDWTLHNLGVLLRVTGRLEEAESALRAAVEVDPTNPHIRHSLGMTLLQSGKYAEGWRFYEARFQVNPTAHPPHLPEWRGGSLAGKRLVMVGEQGLGDQILFARFVGATDADEVTLVSARPLVRLLSVLPAQVINVQTWDDVTGDCWAHVGSVPQRLELGPRDAPAPYLPCPPRPLTGVGLMLEGAPRNPNNAQRLPGAAVRRAICGLGAFVDLSPEASGARDFAETAEIVAGLEFVVTVDTSVAHLAGAMGKPCYVLMAHQAIDWYTNRQDDRTPWYPSIRLIRQRRAGDWAGVIADLAAALGET